MRRSIHSIAKQFSLAILRRDLYTKLLFLYHQGHRLHLDNPKTLNEKIQWLKLRGNDTNYARWADKAEAKQLVTEVIGENVVIPTLGLYESPDEIDFDALPDSFAIKSTHASGQVVLVREKRKLDRNALKNKVNRWLEEDYGKITCEAHYSAIKPRIIVEPLLSNEDGSQPLDYKFHCIGGAVIAIQVDLDRNTAHRRNFYDEDWNRLDFTWSVWKHGKPMWPGGREVPKPAGLESMIEYSRKIAASFPYARIDWYYVRDRIYFGEVTFYHGGGFERICPESTDRRFGEILHLPPTQQLNKE